MTLAGAAVGEGLWNVATIGKEKKTSPACLGVWLKAEVEVVAFPRLH